MLQTKSVIKLFIFVIFEFKQIVKFIIFYINGKKFYFQEVDRIGEFILGYITLYNYIKTNNKSNIIIIYSDNEKEFKIGNKFILNQIIFKFNQEKIKTINSVLIIKVLKFFKKNFFKTEKFQNISSREYYLLLEKKQDNPKINYIPRSQQDNGDLEKNFMFISPKFFYKEHTNLIDDLLKKNNLKRKEFITTFTRDSAYLKKIYPNYNFSYHDFRNLKYEKLKTAIDFILSKNLKAVRIGNIKREIDKIFFSKNHLDLKYNLKDQHVEMCLIAYSKFFLTDTSGIADIADIFNVPMVKVNWCPIFSSVRKKVVILPRLFKSLKNNEILNFFELFELLKKNNLIYVNQKKSYRDLGLEVIESDDKDILNAVKEINNRVDEDNFDALNQYQQKFEKKMKEIGFPNPGLVENNFIKKYYNLFI